MLGTGTEHYVVKTCRVELLELALLVITRAVCLVYDLDQEKEQAKQEFLSENQKKTQK